MTDIAFAQPQTAPITKDDTKAKPGSVLAKLGTWLWSHSEELGKSDTTSFKGLL